MDISNHTKISEDLIKAIAEVVGLDLREDGLLYIEYSTDLKGHAMENLGSCQTVHVERPVYLIKLVPWADTLTLVHEMRHAAQAQLIGVSEFNALYEMELESESYWYNVFEEDARDAEIQWSRMMQG